jgi:hypothetical protein
MAILMGSTYALKVQELLAAALALYRSLVRAARLLSTQGGDVSYMYY